jgi:hypothetical protein
MNSDLPSLLLALTVKFLSPGLRRTFSAMGVDIPFSGVLVEVPCLSFVGLAGGRGCL